MSNLTTLGLDTYIEAVAIKASSEKIEEIAREIAEKHKYLPGDDVVAIANKLGGKIEYKEFREWEKSHSGSILVNGPNDFQIYLSNFHGPLRNRFTLMHEVGHYILHSDFGKTRIKAARFGDSLVEREANQFAASFLMPKDKFLEEWNKNNSLIDLTSKFLVSLTAARVRLSYLGAQF